MFVSEAEWFKAFTISYVRKYVQYRDTTSSPMAGVTAPQAVTESFWIGGRVYSLKEAPSAELSEAVAKVLSGFQSLPVAIPKEEKERRLSELQAEWKDGNAAEAMASAALAACLE
jgi:DNA-binding NarL/FixJ family response regulator